MADIELLELLQKSQEQNMSGFEILAENLLDLGKILKKQEMRETQEEEAKRKAKEVSERESMEKSKWDAMEKSVHEYINKSIMESSAAITKTVSDSVLAAVKQVFQGMDVDATKLHAVDGGDVKLPPQKWPMSTREHRDVDKEDAAKLRTDTQSVQNPIQAMQKHNVLYKDEDAPVNDVSVDDEYRAEENDVNDVPTLEDMQKAFAELKSLKAEVTNIRKSYTDDIKKGVSEQLRTFGIREEINLSPKVSKTAKLGASEMPIKKSVNDTKDPIEVLSHVRTADLMNEWLKDKGFAIGNGTNISQQASV